MLKLMPMNIYDVAAQQARMEDQAARGWFAVSVPGIFFLAVFEKGEPKAVRYRLEPAPVKESCPDPERLAAYQSMGWEYVDTSGKPMHLWRCDDPDAPELHTDPETEAQAYDRLFRRQQKVTQFWAAVTALLAVLAVQTLLTERTLLVWSVQEWKPLWRGGGRLLGLSAGTRIGGVPAVVVSTTVSAAFAGGSTRVPQAALPAGLRIVPGDHAAVGNLHRITLRRYGGPQIAAL